jgi:hypothetical protein
LPKTVPRGARQLQRHVGRLRHYESEVDYWNVKYVTVTPWADRSALNTRAAA